MRSILAAQRALLGTQVAQVDRLLSDLEEDVDPERAIARSVAS